MKDWLQWLNKNSGGRKMDWFLTNRLPSSLEIRSPLWRRNTSGWRGFFSLRILLGEEKKGNRIDLLSCLLLSLFLIEKKDENHSACDGPLLAFCRSCSFNFNMIRCFSISPIEMHSRRTSCRFHWKQILRENRNEKRNFPHSTFSHWNVFRPGIDLIEEKNLSSLYPPSVFEIFVLTYSMQILIDFQELIGKRKVLICFDSMTRMISLDDRFPSIGERS